MHELFVPFSATYTPSSAGSSSVDVCTRCSRYCYYYCCCCCSEYWNESWGALGRYGCEVAARFHPSDSHLGTRDCVDDCNLLKNITTKANALRMFHVPLNLCALRNVRIIRNRSIERGTMILFTWLHGSRRICQYFYFFFQRHKVSK